MTDTNLTTLQQILGVKFQNIALLKQALIHRSYLNENKNNQHQSNERFEFLGDAVLELWASHQLFARFPQFKEGDLTNLRALIVRTENLAQVARNFKLGQFLFLSHGEEANGGRDNTSILADTLEAVIGAIFLDSGFDIAQNFLLNFLGPSIDSLSQQNVFKDAKSLFQELSQAKKGITPRYETLSETGPDHRKSFEVGVYLGDQLIATGTGPSKQTAQEAASLQAIKILGDPV